MSHLRLTLANAQEEKVITDFRFGIASETGGAHGKSESDFDNRFGGRLERV